MSNMDQKFPKPLVMRKIDHMLWEIWEDFLYYVGDINNNDLITVPKGFKTDLASVPRIFWTIFPTDGRYVYASTVHDFLYSVQTRTRKEADHIFLEAMQEIGVNLLTRRTMWLAVRVGGWMPWNHHKKQNDQLKSIYKRGKGEER